MMIRRKIYLFLNLNQDFLNYQFLFSHVTAKHESSYQKPFVGVKIYENAYSLRIEKKNHISKT